MNLGSGRGEGGDANIQTIARANQFIRPSAVNEHA